MAHKSPFPGITSCERFDLASCDSPDRAPEVEGIFKTFKTFNAPNCSRAQLKEWKELTELKFKPLNG